MQDAVVWKGYPVAQHQGEWIAEYKGHTIELDRYQTYWGLRWDITIDHDKTVGSGYQTLGEAKAAGIKYVDIMVSENRVPRIEETETETEPIQP